MTAAAHMMTVVAAKTGTARLAALDFTKGALVLIMVLYHWLNYFVGVQGSYYRYLRFLTPSFIFITGFLIARAYLSKSTGNNTRTVKRLLSRGLKLCLIFFGLNAAAALSGSRGARKALVDYSVYFGQSGADGRAAFSILLPIAYLLMTAAGICLIWRANRKAFTVAAAIGVAAVFLLQAAGRSNAFVELISIGLLGILVGAIASNKFKAVLAWRIAIGSAYAIYLVAITFWREVYAMQVVGVCLTLAVLYLAGEGARGWWADAVVLLGKYSLIGYIAQIVILQALRWAAARFGGDLAASLVSLGSAIVLTYGAVLVLDCMRSRIGAVDKAYAAVFS